MLLRFVVSNFLSIREELEFTMFPYSKLKGHTDHIYKTSKIDLLKVAAIYGANGSGKSNLIEALQYLKDMVLDKDNRYKYWPTHFRLSEECTNAPSKFEIEFRINNNYYSYGLEVLKNEIVEEWLYSINPKRNTDKLIFSRKRDKENRITLDVTDKYKKTEKDKILIQLYAEEILDHKTPFIHQVNDKDQYLEIQEAYEWFSNRLFIIYPDSAVESLNAILIRNEKFRKFINEIVPKLDTGILEIDVKKTPFEVFFSKNKEIDKQEEIKKDLQYKQNIVLRGERGEILISKEPDGRMTVSQVITTHKKKGNASWGFYLEEESDGTRRLLELLPAIEMLANGEIVCVVDEIGRSLHPTLLKELLSFSLNQKTEGQFIFTTHESNLLDLKLFRQDEIWFVEKDGTGGTKAYSLSEFKPRYDLDIRKGYLNGRFGAIPFLGNLKDLNWEDAEEEQRV